MQGLLVGRVLGLRQLFQLRDRQRIAITHGRAEKSVCPLLSEFSGASKDDWHLRIAHRQAAEHVSQPGAPARLGPEEVGIITFDHNCGAPDFSETLQLEHEASVGERCGEIGERLALDHRHHRIRRDGAIVAG